MEHHHSAKGWSRRAVSEHWKRPIEWIVTLPPVRDADARGAEDDPHRASPPRAKAAAESRTLRGERIAELHRQVRDGVYDSRATIDVVARRILQSGDL
ncbi:MAG: hypothetical protein M3Z10_12910 [Gemmatimonadota bacterium]|nr:hypothetical protein [Gemmatimonadota bacterium]